MRGVVVAEGVVLEGARGAVGCTRAAWVVSGAAVGAVDYKWARGR